MQDSVFVVGAGWAGLSAAFRLTQQGVHVTLLEAAPQAGGRARVIAFRGERVDNGQHILLGAYHKILSLLNTLGISEQSVLKRVPLNIYLSTQTTPLHFKLNRLMPPLNVIMGFITSIGLSHQERLAALRFCHTVHALNFELAEDCSVLALLLHYHQPNPLIHRLWAPIAVATLSTPIHQASARVFLNVLKDSFTKNARDSHYLFPTVDLSRLFPEPILNFLTQSGADVVYNQRIKKIHIEDNRCVGLETATRAWRCKRIILATPFDTTAELCNSVSQLSEIQRNLFSFSHQPITTVYLRFQNPVNLPFPMIGILDGLAHWIFDRNFANQPNLISIVITGIGAHTDLDHTTLIEALSQELHRLVPSLGALLDFKVICEKRAAFSCDVGIEKRRPHQKTPIKGLFLAGDYTQTGYPAVLEGAVRSGLSAADYLLLESN